ncbi:MAG: 2'-5' RNA ligase family protein [Candidatus Marsarchaeota archaeon]|nr:2'-5' RNA ligase family protein [Candidatus Marsarchaeota archaeon]
MTDTRIIQICPPQRLRKEIIAIMSDFANRYRVYRDASRKNPHITLLDISGYAYRQDSLLDKIGKITKDVKPFKVYIDGVSAFDEPNRSDGPMRRRHNYVIYLHVVENRDISLLHKKLVAGFGEDKMNQREFVPHITISHKDLDKRGFEKALREYGALHFKHGFTVNGVYLYTYAEGSKPSSRYIKFGSVRQTSLHSKKYIRR